MYRYRSKKVNLSKISTFAEFAKFKFETIENKWNKLLPVSEWTTGTRQHALTLSQNLSHALLRSSPPQVFLGKGILKICSKFTGEHPCRSEISVRLQNNFIEITLWHVCSPVNLMHIFGTHFPKNTFGRLFLSLFIVNSASIWNCHYMIPYHQFKSCSVLGSN